MRSIINWLLRHSKQQVDYLLIKGGSWHPWPDHVKPPTSRQLKMINELKGNVDVITISGRYRFQIHPTFIRWWGASDTHCVDFSALRTPSTSWKAL